MKNFVRFTAFLFAILFNQSINANEFIAFRCEFYNIADKDEEFAFLISKDNESFYVVPNTVGGIKSALFMHTPNEFASTFTDNDIFRLKITFIELLGSGGVNTTTIDIKTKESWHSRHNIFLSQYKGQCETDLDLSNNIIRP